MPFTHQEEVKIAGAPVILPKREADDEWVSIVAWMNMHGFHHYCRGRVATQFCSFQRKKQRQGEEEEWMAFHDEKHFDCIGKVADAVDSGIAKTYETCARTAVRCQGQELEIFYPVIVVQGDLLDVRPTKRSASIRAAKHIQFRHSQMRGKGSEEYQIDVLTESFFPDYLDLIEAEIRKIDRLLRRRKKAVTMAVKKLSEKMKEKRRIEDRIAVLRCWWTLKR